MNTENTTQPTSNQNSNFTQVKGRHLHRMAPPSWLHKDLFPIWRAAVDVYVEENGGDPAGKMAYPSTIAIMKALIRKATGEDINLRAS